LLDVGVWKRRNCCVTKPPLLACSQRTSKPAFSTLWF
jgi:hypothetical protein